MKKLRAIAYMLAISLGVSLSPKAKLLAQKQEKQTIGAVVCMINQKKSSEPSPRFPVLRLHSEEKLSVDFDLLDEQERILAYRLIHCNYNWRPSNLQTIEYIDGFAEYELAPAEYSNNTLQSYLHYRLSLPSEETQIKMSGNYRLEIYDIDEPDETILSIPFAVYKEAIAVSGEVISQTYQEARGELQQVNVELKLANDNNPRASQEIKLVVLQNGRWDNAVVLNKPSDHQRGVLIYQDYNGAVFEGGNEYHKLEHLLDRGTALGVYKQNVFAGRYRLELYPNKNRSQEAYIYDKDQNGRSYIQTQERAFSDTEADYHWVDFSFVSPKLKGGNVVIEGEYFNYLPLSQRIMSYDEDKQCYSKRLLVKQGYQEYQYLFCPFGTRKLKSAETEGNHYQSTNDYQVLVYRRQAQDKADKLVGYTQTKY